MAPRKSNVNVEDKGKSVAATPSRRQTRSMDRLTRSQTRQRGGPNSSGGSSSSKLMTYESPEKKKRKTTPKEGEAKKKVKKEEEEETAVEVKKEEGEPAKEDDADAEEVSEVKKIVIEHCKQCRSFGKRAQEAKEGLEKAVPGIVVTVNADKPRRGCFEIRDEGGEIFISLLDLKRPFKPMKDLDMDEVVTNIVEKIK